MQHCPECCQPGFEGAFVRWVRGLERDAACLLRVPYSRLSLQDNCTREFHQPPDPLLPRHQPRVVASCLVV